MDRRSFVKRLFGWGAAAIAAPQVLAQIKPQPPTPVPLQIWSAPAGLQRRIIDREQLLGEAIADAKVVRETALANARHALEEAFRLKFEQVFSQNIGNDKF